MAKQKNLKGEFTVAPYIDQGKYYPNMSIIEVAESYNGIGAEWMDEDLRGMLDKWFEVLKDAIIIHDCDYDRGITKEDKDDADSRMKCNMYKCVWHNCSFYEVPKMMALFACVRAMYRAVQLGGASAFYK